MTLNEIPLIRVRQWLDDWDKVPVDAQKFQSAPPREFFVASIPARDLRALSGVYQRDANSSAPRSSDPYVQRALDVERTEEITRYVKEGYPLSGLGKKKISNVERDSLRKPGWLPTAIVANIIRPGENRGENQLDADDAMRLSSAGALSTLTLPSTWTKDSWRPKPQSIPPLEIIDGQHRLSAFDDKSVGDFDVPVVIFDGLDFSWQAYLFWTINIKPKRINASLAYDLYPLLREQDWLEAGEGLNVYRETRSQELVEALWRNPRSVWFERINMLGRNGVRANMPVTQSAFIGSLSTTFVRPFHGQKGLGGLFGGGADGAGLNWPRQQQAALLIFSWRSLALAISEGYQPWAEVARGLVGTRSGDVWSSLESKEDPAVVGEFSLLTSDQGVRAFHMVVNDILYLSRESLTLDRWVPDESVLENPRAVDLLIDELDGLDPGQAIRSLTGALASYDWRNSQAPELTADEKDLKLSLRGSGGYNVLRERLLRHLYEVGTGWVKDRALEVMVARGISR